MTARSAREELRSYIEQLRGRLRMSTLLRGAAVLAASALGATLVLVALANRFAFSAGSLWSARGALWLTLLAGAAFGLALPLWRLTHRSSARRAEEAFPELGQRLLTFAERDPADGPFLDLLAADTLRITPSPKRIVTDAALAAMAGLGLGCLAVLVWLIRAGPGYWGYGAAALWTGAPHSPLYAIRVSPGDAAVRRNGDQLVVAQPLGLQVAQVRLHARIGRASRWDSVAMEPQPRGSGFEFLLAGIPDDVEYYIEAGAMASPHYHLRVADVPAVVRIRVRLHYPAWTKLADTIDEHGGDLRAVAGTEALLDVSTDRPLRKGVLVLDDGREIQLTAEPHGRVYHGSVKIDRDGAYHVAARDGGRTLRISEDYFIEAAEVKPPEVAIVRPGGDYRASPIEEVTVGARASDAFGLEDLTLHYSVNGSPEQTVALLGASGAKQASGTAVISLESLKLSPGDVVSLYASAKDARTESRTDLEFIQVEPFEREFSQSQQAGGGGGFGSGEAQIAEREKEIIAATWKQAAIESPAPRQAAEQAKFLSDAQNALRSQSEALAGRVQLRELTSGNEAIGRFQQEMLSAADAMQPAAGLLGSEHWREALPSEQKALEHLLRAEATFREIEVAFASLGGGSGAPNSAGRDLASLFDLELDMQKNQYETRQDAQSRSGRANAIDDVLRRLDDIARRQQALADQQSAAQTAEQRWQEEMLRRNAEDLRREIETLARNQAGEGRAAGQSGAAARAANRLREAEEEMRRAVDRRDEAGARSAAERLREAMNELSGLKQEESESQLGGLKLEAARLANEEHRQAARLREAGRAGGSPPGMSGLGAPGAARGSPGSGDLQSLIDARQRLADDLARLEAQMRNAERETLPRSRVAASKLRDALNDLDQADTETQLQRSADIMRRGYLSGDDSREGDIESSLQHLADQIGEAGAALARGEPSSDEALASVERLRDRLAALEQGLQASADRGGGVSRGVNGRLVGPVTAGGGGRAGFINGGWDPGVDPALRGRNGAAREGAAASSESAADAAGVAPSNAPPGLDPEQNFRQSLGDLGRLRRAVGDDPQSRRQVDELIRAMQRLDPRRFPGNPAMVDELYGRVLSDVDRLELQLRRETQESQPAEIRSERPLDVPPGYQEAVAEYYRRLSQAAR